MITKCVSVGAHTNLKEPSTGEAWHTLVVLQFTITLCQKSGLFLSKKVKSNFCLPDLVILICFAWCCRIKCCFFSPLCWCSACHQAPSSSFICHQVTLSFICSCVWSCGSWIVCPASVVCSIFWSSLHLLFESVEMSLVLCTRSPTRALLREDSDRSNCVSWQVTSWSVWIGSGVRCWAACLQSAGSQLFLTQGSRGEHIQSLARTRPSFARKLRCQVFEASSFP